MYAKKESGFRRLGQWFKLFAVIIGLVMALVYDPCAVVINAFNGNDASIEENTTEATYPEAAEGINENHKAKVKNLVYRETESNENQVMMLSFVVEENAEEWSSMHVCVDVSTIYHNLDGDILGEIDFAEKVEVSSEECLEGWCKVSYNGLVGYMKTEHLMTANEMLDTFQYFFAQVLYAEAGGVGMWEMRLVGEVVFNRLTTDYWEFEPYCTTLWRVISQSGQYPDTYRKICNGLVPSEEAMEVARAMLLDEYDNLLPDECLWQTGFYPSWDVKIIVRPGEWKLDNGMTITVYHYYSVLND